jgi:hypothetical protein
MTMEQDKTATRDAGGKKESKMTNGKSSSPHTARNSSCTVLAYSGSEADPAISGRLLLAKPFLDVAKDLVRIIGSYK